MGEGGTSARNDWMCFVVSAGKQQTSAGWKIREIRLFRRDIIVVRSAANIEERTGSFELHSLRPLFVFRTLFVVLQLEPSPAKYGVNDGGEDEKTEDI